MKLLSVLSLCLARAATGCGGSGADEAGDPAGRAANEWVTAMIDRDSEKACSLMTDQAILSVAQTGRPSEPFTDTSLCPEVMPDYREHLGEGVFQRMAAKPYAAPDGTTPVDGVTVYSGGDTAKSDLPSIAMKKVGDAWKVNLVLD